MKLATIATCLAVAASMLGVSTASIAAPTSAAQTSGVLTWQAPTVVDPARGGFSDISCLSPAFCRAGGDHGSVLAYDGHAWTREARLAGTTQVVRRVTCTARTFCLATTFGNNAVYLSTGGSWSRTDRIDVAPDLSCVDRTFCLALSTWGNAERWDGSSWTDVAGLSFGIGHRYTAVSCASATLCWAVDNRGAAYRWNGSAWSDGTAIDGDRELVALDCQTTSFCVAVDSAGNAVRGDGTAWSAPQQVDPARALTGIDCSSPGFCAAVDDAGRVAELRGGVWTAPAAIEDGARLVAVSCPTSAFCAAVSNTGSVVRRVDGTWHAAEPVNTAYGAPRAVSCASPTLCILVDTSGAIARYDGTRWGRPSRLVTDGDALTDVSCPSTRFCMAVTDDARAYLRSASGRWSRGLHTGLSQVNGVSCTSTVFCLLVGDSSVQGATTAATWNGASFELRPIDTPQYQFQPHRMPTCGRAGDCMTLTDTHTPSLVHYRNGSWTHPLTGSNNFSVDCATDRSCMVMTFPGDDTEANGLAGVAARWTGSAFTPTSNGSGLPLFHVACAPASRCVAGEAGQVSTWTGGAWSGIETIDPASLFDDPRTPRMQDLDCRRSVCVAVMSDGAAIVGR